MERSVRELVVAGVCFEVVFVGILLFVKAPVGVALVFGTAIAFPFWLIFALDDPRETNAKA